MNKANAPLQSCCMVRLRAQGNSAGPRKGLSISRLCANYSSSMMSSTPERLVLATRGSPLALAQARIVAQLVERAYPELSVETMPVTTRGDADRRAFPAIGGKGLFVAEVERAVA